MINKYIKEQSIVLLINKYVELNIIEIYESMYTVKNKIYYNKDKMKTCSASYNRSKIIVYFLTDNLFGVMENTHDTLFHDMNITEIKFNKNEKNIYTNILKESRNLSKEEFKIKYYTELHKNENYCQLIPDNLFSLNYINNLFDKYNIKLYNIKMLLFAIDFIDNNFVNNKLDLFVNNNFVCTIQNYFSRKIIQNINMQKTFSDNTYEISIDINISNL
jgi:hypothetical protein